VKGNFFTNTFLLGLLSLFDLRGQCFYQPLKEVNLILLMNSSVGILEIVIGIKLWFAPQISEHCPLKSPIRFIRINS
jgi:hypothetical protein